MISFLLINLRNKSGTPEKSLFTSAMIINGVSSLCGCIGHEISMMEIHSPNYYCSHLSEGFAFRVYNRVGRRVARNALAMVSGSVRAT